MSASAPLPEVPPRQGTRKPTAAEVIRAVSAALQIDAGMVVGRSRDAMNVLARAVIFFILRNDLGQSYPQIGKYFRRHHTTVINAVQRMNEGIDAYALEVVAHVRESLRLFVEERRPFSPAKKREIACAGCVALQETVDELRARLDEAQQPSGATR